MVLQAFALIRQKIAEPYMDVLLKEAAHQIVLVSEALRFHTVRSKKHARRSSSAAANYVGASSCRPCFPARVRNSIFSTVAGRVVGDDRSDVRVQQHGGY